AHAEGRVRPATADGPREVGLKLLPRLAIERGLEQLLEVVPPRYRPQRLLDRARRTLVGTVRSRCVDEVVGELLPESKRLAEERAVAVGGEGQRPPLEREAGAATEVGGRPRGRSVGRVVRRRPLRHEREAPAMAVAAQKTAQALAGVA